jgi:competence protein ComEC
MKFGFVVSILMFCLGIALGSLLGINLEAIVWLLLVSLTLMLLSRVERVNTTSCIASAVAILFLGLGCLRSEMAAQQFDQSALSASLNEMVTVEGVVVREPDYREYSVHLYVETKDDLVLVTADRLLNISYGDEVRATGTLEAPSSFTTDLGRTFDYPNYLRARGVEYRIGFAEIEALRSGQGNPVIGWLLSAKETFVTSLDAMIPEPEVGLGKGLLLGIKSALGEDIETDFRRTGIIHIVVLSGYNVMLVVSFIMFCFSFFLPLRPRIVTGVLAITAFALIVGLSATVVRASIMAVLVLLAQALHRQYDVLRGLLVAGVIMVTINPYLLLYDIGFQLSFMATLGLIVIVPHFETNYVRHEGVFKLKDFFFATLATQIAVLPLLLYHIGEISLLAVVVNVLVLPIVPIAMFLTFLSGLFGLISGGLGLAVGFLAQLTLSCILVIAEVFGGLPFAAVAVPAFSPGWIVVMYGAIGWVFWRWQKRDQKADTLTSDWTIVDERELQSAGLSSSPEATDKPADDLPVFFR